ncbi:type II toxin-antitoxin system VapC family toxin [Candidatus Roizmanbacteria bacterium]|nr:type II toxin-antitoxin system VapC family toxin [Candidatus Roizmanbacteria bacterium]MBI4009324.1 type II toxin-antitoxin system VapC family toxin [Candidatus Roizmanbacteria bacterium]
MDQIILDASVLIKLFHPEEQDKIAERLLVEFNKRKLSFVILDLALYEFVNALKFSKKARKEFILSALTSILDLNPEIISYSNEFMEKILDLLDKFTITLYDASFIAAAEMEKIPLLTADYKHHIKSMSKHVLHYKDFDV